jgi:formylglycine-generating enzyme required for sulfatase activity
MWQMEQIIDWILKDKTWQWFFSGAGFIVISGLYAWFRHSQQKPKKGKKSAAKNSGNNLAATFFITMLTPLLTFIIVLKYIDDNPATKPKSLVETLLVLLLAIAAAAAVSMIVTRTYKTIKTWAVFFILIPFLSMTASLTSAWYLLEKPSFPDLVRPLIPFLSKLPPSEAVPPESPVPEKAPAEPGKNSVKHGESSDMTGEKSQKSDESGETSESQNGTKPEMKDQTDSKEASSVPGTVPGTVNDISNTLGMKFVYIPPGTFMMGSPENEPGRQQDEKLHRVTLTQGFYMQTTEVTQKQWKDVMGDNPSLFKECGDDCPVENVSWDDVQEFIKRLNESERTDSYRLPTEAEWEYAARSGKETAYCFGDDAAELGGYAWYIENSGIKTHPVAKKQPNAWGLCDMHGNVWEWCQDWYGDYPSGEVVDPVCPEPLDLRSSFHVFRGGGWYCNAQNCRSANRDSYPVVNGPYGLGFRLVLPVGQHKSEP